MHRRDYQQTDSIYDQTLACILLQAWAHNQLIAWAHSQLIVSMHKHKHIYDFKKIGQSDGACQMRFLHMNIERNSTLTQMGFYKCDRNPCERQSLSLRRLCSTSQEA